MSTIHHLFLQVGFPCDRAIGILLNGILEPSHSDHRDAAQFYEKRVWSALLRTNWFRQCNHFPLTCTWGSRSTPLVPGTTLTVHNRGDIALQTHHFNLQAFLLDVIFAFLLTACRVSQKKVPLCSSYLLIGDCHLVQVLITWDGG